MESFMKEDKILITGGLGFIGMNVANLLVEQGRQVLLFDNLSPQIHGAIPDLSSLPLLRSANVEVVRGNVCRHDDWGAVLADVGCIVHLAAETGTAQSMYEISRYTETNVSGTARLLDYLANHKHNVIKIILASSRSVYGEGAYQCGRCGVVFPSMRSVEMLRCQRWQPECPTCGDEIGATATREDAKTAPASIYAATKLAQEDLVRIAGNALGISTVIFRLQNVYGEGQSLRNPYTGILSIFSNQIRLGKIVNLYEDGQESRDFVHVSDVARAIVLGVTSDRADGNTLNVGYGKPTSVERIALLLSELLGADTQPIVSGQYRVGDIRHGYADTSAIYQRLGFTPELSLEQGLDRFVAWVRRQPMEDDRLDAATQELLSRGFMEKHVEAQATSL
jgi:dTDP-L-rhamnose 4-epimerase